jgi:hypothetical protein
VGSSYRSVCPPQRSRNGRVCPRRHGSPDAPWIRISSVPQCPRRLQCDLLR